MPTGNFSTRSDNGVTSGKANFDFNVSGPKGPARVHAEASLPKWEVEVSCPSGDACKHRKGDFSFGGRKACKGGRRGCTGLKAGGGQATGGGVSESPTPPRYRLQSSPSSHNVELMCRCENRDSLRKIA